MSEKQDRVAPRTAADIERKYNFGKKFSEILGLIDESRDHVDSVESGLRDEITKTETSISRNTEEIVATAKAEVQTTISNVQKEIGEELTELGKAQAKLGEAQTELGNAQTELENEMVEITKSLEVKMDAEAVDIAIERKISGVNIDEVETRTGYRFDANGLSISKSGEEMSNVLDNTGMYVKRSGEEILTANNEGVKAVNLHAKTYLIIGAGNGRSRLEDYGTNRTGVFWIG